MMLQFSLLAAFLTGLSGSVHCLGMCGGVSGALGMRARAAGQSAAQALWQALLYQVGRLSSYTVAGALCGAFGGWLARAMDLAGVTQALRIATGVLLILLGCQLAFGWRLLQPIEALGAKLWQRMVPFSGKLFRFTPMLQALLLGALWGWLPCGLVYSILLLGVLGGTPVHGAAVMLAFGVGTLPAMLASSLLAAQLTRAARQQGVRAMAGALLMLFGLWMIVAVLRHAGH